MNAIADLRRRLDNMIRSGTIAEVDHGDPAQGRLPCCRVKTGAITTGWLHFFTCRAGSTNEWSPVSVGEQCTILSPSGELAQGQVLVGLYSEANPPCSNSPDVHRVEWANGDFLEHNAATGALTLQCSGPVSINGSRIDLN
ncbi:baseplate assembly protein [Pseudomonas sp. EGD-AK9]|uniref:phage baseplate assembly protein V n=1 Tax=Pseudomonas sp. EGD-AK9 TaxID=1386078 RepID=UPI000396657B|nr:phage baseplate assembly protein V [Pseudomonas sp. EGD-AK9]ERI52122.1 baseplate assembly protein [Pseudomonas sp. EGD-AK9]